MADYYSLLSRAVANLPKSSPPSTRRAIYERARKALTNQLRSLKPQLPESDIAREERALDDAVARLEAEFEPAAAVALAAAPTAAAPAAAELAEPAPPVAEAPVAPAAPPAPAPPPPAPPRAPEAPRPPEAPRAPAAARPAAPPAPPKSAPPRPAPPRAPLPPAAGLPNATAFKGPLLGGADATAPETSSGGEPQVGPARADSGAEGPAPALGPVVSRYEREPARPVLNEAQRRKTPTWLWIAGAVAVGFAGSVAVVALVMRPALQDLSVPAPVDTPAAAAAAAQEKTLRRVGQANSAETPGASSTAEAANAAPPSPDASPPPSPSLTNPAAAPTVADTPTAAPPNAAPTVPIASRAAMLVATVADAAKPTITVGTAVWSVVPAPAGQPAAMIGVKSEIDIPDLKLHASMILRKNFDASLPASHTIDLRVTFDPGSNIKGIKDIALPLMRRDDPPAADALTGVRVKISDNYFLVGLNRAEADVARNVQEIAERGWFDFPMQLDDDRIAKLTFEKGADGEKIVAQALAAWK